MCKNSIKGFEVTKGLLEKVLGYKITRFKLDENTIKIITNEKMTSFGNFFDQTDINLHEFAHVNCKKWMLDKGYNCSSGMGAGDIYGAFCSMAGRVYRSDTEPKAIFKALGAIK